MTVYLNYELHYNLQEIMKKAEEKRLFFLNKAEKIKEEYNDPMLWATPESRARSIKEETEPVFNNFSDEIEIINNEIENEIKKYINIWTPDKYEKINMSQLKEILEFTKFDIKDELLEEIILQIMGPEWDNIKMLTVIRQIYNTKKMNTLFTRLESNDTLLKLLNEDMEEMSKYKIDVQTEENYEEKYQDFLNKIEEIQTKIFEIKTGR